MKALLSEVLLSEALAFPTTRTEMPMSTLLATETTRLETEWDGARIGDVHIRRLVNDKWELYGSVTCGKVKGYRWLDGEPKAEPVAPPKVPAHGAAAKS